MQQLFIVPTLHRKPAPHNSNGNPQLFLPHIPEVLFQLRKVLRAKIGDTLFVQAEMGGNTRYELKITSRTEKDLEGEILQEETLPTKKKACTMLIALPNRREKAELIVQKLTEIGIDEIGFRPAERSVINQWNTKKAERLMKIAKEAVEQSWGIHLPKIIWYEQLETISKGKRVLIFDRVPLHTVSPQNCEGEQCGVIGPEGGLTPKDYANFPEAEIISLGPTVLRMETAAIVGGWMLCRLL